MGGSYILYSESNPRVGFLLEGLVEDGVSSSPVWLASELLFINIVEMSSFFSNDEKAFSLLPEAAPIPSQDASPILKITMHI